MRVTREDVLEAQERIAGRIRRTPLLAPALLGGPWVKAEFLQHCGVFKTRGAFNRQLAGLATGEIGEAGIVVASGGNAGLAQAYAADRLGVRASVFVPIGAPAVKVDLIRSYGAEVHQAGSEYAEAYQAAVAYADATGAAFAHAYDQVEIAAGAGTLGEEILADEPEIDTIVVAVGGGGLYAGVAAAVRSRARIVAVEPESCPTLRRAMDTGRPVDVAVSGVAADSLGARRLGELAFTAVTEEPPTSVLVTDEEIVEARWRLWSELRIPSEHGAAAAYAALTSGRYAPSPDERVAVVICGANTDPRTLAGDATGHDG